MGAGSSSPGKKTLYSKWVEKQHIQWIRDNVECSHPKYNKLMHLDRPSLTIAVFADNGKMEMVPVNNSKLKNFLLRYMIFGSGTNLGAVENDEPIDFSDTVFYKKESIRPSGVVFRLTDGFYHDLQVFDPHSKECMSLVLWQTSAGMSFFCKPQDHANIFHANHQFEETRAKNFEKPKDVLTVIVRQIPIEKDCCNPSSKQKTSLQIPEDKYSWNQNLLQEIKKEIRQLKGMEKLCNITGSSCQRTVVLNGEPGTGKTVFCQYVGLHNGFRSVIQLRTKGAYDTEMVQKTFEEYQGESTIYVIDDFHTLYNKEESRSWLLSVFDGQFFQFTKPTLFMITTNESLVLKPEFMRRGRLDRQIEVRAISSAQELESFFGSILGQLDQEERSRLESLLKDVPSKMIITKSKWTAADAMSLFVRLANKCDDELVQEIVDSFQTHLSDSNENRNRMLI